MLANILVEGYGLLLNLRDSLIKLNLVIFPKGFGDKKKVSQLIRHMSLYSV